MVACPECDAHWDGTTAGFCGRCGALLDSPAAAALAPALSPPRPAPPATAPTTSEQAVVGALVLLLAVTVAATVAVQDGPRAADRVDLPRDARPATVAEVAPEPADPPCRVGGGAADCITWRGAWRPLFRSTQVEDGVLVGLRSGRLRGVDLTTGETRWSLDTGLPSASVRSADGGRLAVSDGSRLLMLDVVDGTVLWESDRTEPLDGDAVLADVDLVLTRAVSAGGDVETPGTAVIGRSLADGSQRWRIEFVGATAAARLRSHRLTDGSVLVTASDGAAALVAPGDGTVRWADPSAGDVLAVGDGGIVFSRAMDADSSGGALLEVRRPDDGTLLWDLPLRGDERSVVAGEVVVVWARHSRAYGLRDGRSLWDRLAPLDAVTAVAPEGVMLLEFDERTLAAIDETTGAVLWSRRSSDGPIVQVRVSGEHLVVMTRAGVHLWDRASGALAGSVAVPEPIVLSLDPLVIASPPEQAVVGTDLQDRLTSDT